MAVKALFVPHGVTNSGSNIQISCSGLVIGGSAFDEDFIIGTDAGIPNLNAVLADAVKTYLSGAPHNVTFNSGDVVRMVPAIL